MSVYKSENPAYMDRALRSVWDDQTLKPDEIVLVQDGALGDELNDVITQWKTRLGAKLVTLRNETNLGLTKSLNKGLQHAKGKFIAFCLEEIRKPIPFIKGKHFSIKWSWSHHLPGGYIFELSLVSHGISFFIS